MTINDLHAIRSGDRGLTLTLYLDIDEDEADTWNTFLGILALDRTASHAVLEVLTEAPGDVVALEDEGARAVSLITNGEPRWQAFIAPMLEAFREAQRRAAEAGIEAPPLDTRRVIEVADELDYYAEIDAAAAVVEWERLCGEQEEGGSDGRVA